VKKLKIDESRDIEFEDPDEQRSVLPPFTDGELDDELLDDDVPGANDRKREPAGNAERAIREAELADVKRFIRFTRTINPMALPSGSERWARENVDRIYHMRLTGPFSSQRHEAVCLWHHRERKRLAKMPKLIEGEW
jgi:hypothetical protein